MPIIGSDNEFAKLLLDELGSDPAPPDAGLVKLYALAADKLPYAIDSTGAVTPLGITVTPDAEDVPYDNGSSGLTADDVQEAIDELATLAGVATHFTMTWDLGLTTGAKRPQSATDGGTIVGWRLLSDASVTISADLWKDTFANYPPVNADSITAAAPVAMTTDDEAEDTTLSGWTTAVVAGDIIIPNVDSITPGSATYVVLELRIAR